MRKLFLLLLIILSGCQPAHPAEKITSTQSVSFVSEVTPTTTATDTPETPTPIPPTIEVEWANEEYVIAYIESDKFGYHIYITSLYGEKIEEATKNFQYAGNPVWSPDGNFIAFNILSSAHRDVYLIDLHTYEVTLLAELPTGYPLSRIKWAPDSKSIVYNDVNSMYIMELSPQKITKTIEFDFQAISLIQWSSDGNSIYMGAYHGDLLDIYKYSLVDAEINKLTPAPLDIRGHSISPDETLLAYTETESGDIYILNLESGKKEKILDTNGYIFGIVWSPDSSKIYFEFRQIENNEHIDIYQIDPTGENLTQITNFAGDEVIDWGGSNGSKILFHYSFMEDEFELGKERLGSDGFWAYDVEKNIFEYFEGTEDGQFASWRP